MLNFKSLNPLPIQSVIRESVSKLTPSLKPEIEKFELASDFLRKSFLGVAWVCLVMMTPFSVNNFLQGRYLRGIGSLAIISIFAFSAWTITRYNRYYANLTLFGLLPAILFFLSRSLKNQGMIGVFWSYPAASSLYFMLPERKAWLANAVLLAVALPLAWDILEPALAIRMVITLVMVSIFSAIFVRVITEQQNKLKAQAVTDPLTGLYNRTLLGGRSSKWLDKVTAQAQL